jgi:hypothetical protein
MPTMNTAAAVNIAATTPAGRNAPRAGCRRGKGDLGGAGYMSATRGYTIAVSKDTFGK